MNTLLRIYLVLIFASSALNAGPENDLINKEFPMEASNFATNRRYPQNLEGITDCMSSTIQMEESAIVKSITEKSSIENSSEELSK
ncbi:hypothetical protein [Algoriphagus aquimarinus]|uniref:Uncharacterized protein n=1 Tax=Algoriphagus aquimarinus TaxID=237018 RepID=A0A5C7APK7_9BACT|nr:hypothetical protein [Algoriphagus aquimarinus]TXE10307.1 hypothetical protein ESV85_13310 [Algoriphagus aquimarinus]